MSVYIVPFLFATILIAAIYRRLPVYQIFLEGAEQGMQVVISIFPTILAVLTAVGMLRSSGALELLIHILSPLTEWLGIPKEVMPLALMRPISGGGSLGILSELFGRVSPDSEPGVIASVLMGSTETTFYTLCVYFRKTRVKYTKQILPAALLGDLVGILCAVWVTRMLLFR